MNESPIEYKGRMPADAYLIVILSAPIDSANAKLRCKWTVVKNRGYQMLDVWKTPETHLNVSRRKEIIWDLFTANEWAT